MMVGLIRRSENKLKKLTCMFRTMLFLGAALLFSGCSSPTSVSGGNASLDIVNRSGGSIWYLYLSPCSSNTWGEDQLGSDVIVNGETYSFSITPGCWDLRAEAPDGRNTERFGVQMGFNDSKSWTITASGK